MSKGINRGTVYSHVVGEQLEINETQRDAKIFQAMLYKEENRLIG